MADYFKALGDRDSWWFMFFYSVTFGGFIGLASALPGYFNDQYGLSPVTAGYYTAACVFGGSLMRPWAARWPTASAASAPCWACTAWRRSALRRRRLQPAQLLRRTGAVRLHHARPGRRQWRGVPAGAAAFPSEIGVMTGLIGMAGGIGGFALAAGMGAIKQSTGSYQWPCGCSPASACWPGSACTASSVAGEPPGVRRP
jgi:NNP family nitrate/nitrite transporter-like MFS transporter